MIELGLGRVRSLLYSLPLKWQAIHVAGTNGKGSVCSYISSILKVHGVKHGMFNSPHLIDRWDCIQFNGTPIDQGRFDENHQFFEGINLIRGIKATEFELLTATAFKSFNDARVDVGVVEVGVGGREDATNILENPLATVITKIGLDHQGLLGSTIEEIASHKAGIMKKGVPCFVDASNEDPVMKVLEGDAARMGVSDLIKVSQSEAGEQTIGLPLHQRYNMQLAYTTCQRVFQDKGLKFENSLAHEAMRNTIWLGRLQRLDISDIIDTTSPVLLDGAHNQQSCSALAAYVEKHFRQGYDKIVWILAASDGKDVDSMLARLLQPQDEVIVTDFSPVAGMPWVKPMDIRELSKRVSGQGVLEIGSGNHAALRDTLARATIQAGAKSGRSTRPNAPIVITGSLYLVSDVLRLLRDSSVENNA